MERPRLDQDRMSTEVALQSLGERLIELSAPLFKLIAEVLQGSEPHLTYRQFRVLLRVGEGHTSLTQLAHLAGISLPTMSESVEGLVQRGMLQRFSEETDRRSTRLVLTKEGEEALRAGRDRVAALAADLAMTLENASKLTTRDTKKFEQAVGLVLEEVRRRRRMTEPEDTP